MPTVAHRPWHFLYFFPLPHGLGSLRPTFGVARTTAPRPPSMLGDRRRRCATLAPGAGLLTPTPFHLHPDETLELLKAGAALSPAPPDLRSGRLL